MALRKMVERLTKPTEERDREALEQFCDTLGATPMDEIEPRRPVRVAGELRSGRIVPRAGAPALEVSVTDGRGSVVAVFLGRRKLAGMKPGRRLFVNGVAGRDGRRFLIYNPEYQLL